VAVDRCLEYMGIASALDAMVRGWARPVDMMRNFPTYIGEDEIISFIREHLRDPITLESRTTACGKILYRIRVSGRKPHQSATSMARWIIDGSGIEAFPAPEFLSNANRHEIQSRFHSKPVSQHQASLHRTWSTLQGTWQKEAEASSPTSADSALST
jgi:hypothetical protein